MLVCPRCKGEGEVEGSRSYGVPCPMCKGARVISDADLERLTLVLEEVGRLLAEHVQRMGEAFDMLAKLFDELEIVEEDDNGPATDGDSHPPDTG